MRGALDLVSLFASSGARLGLGLYASGSERAPHQSIELYEFEACPFCRKVRDAITALDLDALIFPCPKSGTRFRPAVLALGGKEQFPLLHDPNTDVVMYESNDIIDYLYATYGGRRPPRMLRFTPTALAGSAARSHAGRAARTGRAPEQPLELYSFEASPYCKRVRERLCELEIPYLLRNVGKGGARDWLVPAVRARLLPDRAQTTARRQAFVDRSGRMQVPYLVDPNTGVEMFESADIVRYLDETYGAG